MLPTTNWLLPVVTTFDPSATQELFALVPAAPMTVVSEPLTVVPTFVAPIAMELSPVTETLGPMPMPL